MAGVCARENLECIAEKEIAAARASHLHGLAGEIAPPLQVAVDQLSHAIVTARQPGKPLSTISAIKREAPLASLFVAFLLGIAVARRR